MSENKKPQRLCSEIQLFDLCSKEKCLKKKDRFCTDEDLLKKFEAINQEEDFPPDQYVMEGGEEDEEWDEESPGFGSGFDEDVDDDEDEEES
jgi:DNA-directed RNA polymerase delta subunit